jgi:paraquat-inducible protein B
VNDRPNDQPNSQPPRQPAASPAADPAPEFPEAVVHGRRPFHFIWVIPIVAGLIGGFLVLRAVYQRGPEITIQFNSADGLVAGQTRVKHKAVDLGTVRSINLSQDMKNVDVSIEMRRTAARVLTREARFWVVRPRFDASNISGLDTLISGAYIELDPGTPTGPEIFHFTGLEDPPAVRSDEPGRTFTLKTSSVGAISSGSPVFYRDIQAGEVLGYNLGPDGDSMTIHVFVRTPFDQFVRLNSHFWSVSGLSLNLGSQGVQLHVASLQALLSGGIAFDTPKNGAPGPLSKGDATFELFSDEATADNSGFTQRIPFTTYVDGSVRGLAVGAPVELFGLQIGNVTNVALQVAPDGASSRVKIDMEIQPERIAPTPPASSDTARPVPLANANTLNPELETVDPFAIASTLVKRGLRAQLQTTNYLTGQLVLEMVFVPDAPPEAVYEQNGRIVVPSAPGGLDSITTGLSEVTAKLARLPLDQIAKNLNDTLIGVSHIANGSELKGALTTMASTLANIQDLVRKFDAGFAPALKRLPDIAQSLQTSVDRAGKLVGSLDSGYGGNSEFSRDLQRLLVQVSDTARSVRLLADYLDQHPEALIRGRTDRSIER